MTERDYVLGTEAGEIARLGIQHRVWRPYVLDAWRRAGVNSGHTVMDVGAGPGYAAADLAEIVGPAGRVLAVERSRRFLNALERRAASLGLSNIEALERDVLDSPFGDAVADFAWCRWLLCFLSEPRRALANISRALKSGGVAVFHEYADYGAWQMMPPNPDLEAFRDLVMKSWRDGGGEPDVALHLPGWLEAEGFELLDLRPLIHVTDPSDFVWQWPAAFVSVNAGRLGELGYATAEEAQRFSQIVSDAPSGTRMITPLVMEIIARKR